MLDPRPEIGVLEMRAVLAVVTQATLIGGGERRFNAGLVDVRQRRTVTAFATHVHPCRRPPRGNKPPGQSVASGVAALAVSIRLRPGVNERLPGVSVARVVPQTTVGLVAVAAGVAAGGR